jgi:CRP-like cAMP-binding protein
VDWKVFDRGEVIIKEGDEGDTFFIIREGEVSVRIKKNGKKKEIATLGQGSFFGEMSLLTGEPRRATVVARDECELLIVGREHFAGIILKNPSVAEGMSRILVKRKGRIDSELKRRERASEKEKSSWNAFSLFLQIKNVFKT